MCNHVSVPRKELNEELVVQERHPLQKNELESDLKIEEYLASPLLLHSPSNSAIPWLNPPSSHQVK